jgi:hypothetical protein
MDIPALAKEVVAALGSWLPVLTGVEAAAGIVGEGWDRAKAVWALLSAHFTSDVDLKQAAELHARKISDEGRRGVLIDALVDRMKASPELITQLDKILAPARSQTTITADDGSTVKDVRVDSAGNASTTLAASKQSTIEGIKIKSRS